ncbi:multicopper oxidase domain-containing protein [Desertibacillus haloalkaliphilus]|nr:multicopper oxidase domain-containing protein [Desertibacillus haloalkaliphilus]
MLVLVFAVLMMLTSASFASETSSFSDVEQYEDEINHLVQEGIISGFPDGTFRPGEDVIRLHMVQMVMNTLGDSTEATIAPDYRDISEERAGFSAVARATELGIVSGNNGAFFPDDPLTRAELAVIFVRAFQLEGESNVTFNDVSNEHWARDAISILAANEITTGYPDGTFRPNDPVSRAHLSVFLSNYLTDQAHGPNDHTEANPDHGSNDHNEASPDHSTNDDALAESPYTYNVVAREATLERTATQTVPVWGYDGVVPGTELRVPAGEEMTVHFENQLPEQTTIHWHGIALENEMDGVPGVTQDAIEPGESFTYQFTPEDPGTYFYHSHVNSNEQVGKGLYGALIVEEEQPSYERDFALFIDPFGINGSMGANIDHLEVEDGERVRVRFINVNTTTHEIYVNGTDVEVTHTDGMPIHNPEPIRDQFIPIAPGERYDVEFVADKTKDIYFARATRGSINQSTKTLLSYEDGTVSDGEIPSDLEYQPLEITTYGEYIETPIYETSEFDVEFTMDLGITSDFSYTINDHIYPHDFEPIEVSEGDLVKVTMNNPTIEDHPMHLHGHHFYVLSKNGEPISGSALKMDTVNLKPGDHVEIAFEADNPGIWMFHCHILSHANQGMKTKVIYEGVEPVVEGGHQHHR